MRKYLVIGPRAVLDAEPGKELEVELTTEEEADYLDAGRLKVLPIEYEVIGSCVVFGSKPGSKFRAAIRLHQEAALIEGGHIEVVVTKSAGGASATKKESK